MINQKNNLSCLYSKKDGHQKQIETNENFHKKITINKKVIDLKLHMETTEIVK